MIPIKSIEIYTTTMESWLELRESGVNYTVDGVIWGGVDQYFDMLMSKMIMMIMYVLISSISYDKKLISLVK